MKNIFVIEGKCKFEGSFKNGYILNENFFRGKFLLYDSYIEYVCYVLYILDGINILYCNDGFWNVSIFLCKGMYLFCVNMKMDF